MREANKEGQSMRRPIYEGGQSMMEANKRGRGRDLVPPAGLQARLPASAAACGSCGKGRHNSRDVVPRAHVIRVGACATSRSRTTTPRGCSHTPRDVARPRDHGRRRLHVTDYSVRIPGRTVGVTRVTLTFTLGRESGAAVER